MLVEHQAQPAGRRVAIATKSEASNGFRATSQPFTAFAHLEGDRAIVILHGTLDVASIATLIDSILIDCFMGVTLVFQKVVLDFTELDFIDSFGLNAIAVAAQQVTAYGGSVSIRSPRPQILRLLELVDFKQIATIEP
jgi:anti-anti-sigma factor